LSAEHVHARSGAYADSVTLMQISAKARAVAGVQAALVAMGTDLNLGLLTGLGFAVPGDAGPDDTGPNDLLIAIRADDSDSLAAALAVVDEALQARPADQVSNSAEQPPRTTISAARQRGSGLALISVPGPYAFAEAMDALDSDCDVMIFSDNVPVEQEILLKDIAAQRGLLVMGPDCGTAIVAGVGLGFSHTVPPGTIGLVAASGTGAQQVVCLLDAAGAGVSAVLGVGGRDLSAAVGGRSARAALAALDEDPATELIVLLSKPPAAGVAADLRAYADTLATPVQFAMIGPGQPDLTEAAEAALRATGQPVPTWPYWPAAGLPTIPAPGADSRSYRPGGGSHRPGTDQPPTGGALRGLFAGGTLCDEAMVIAAARLGPIYSNIPLQPEWLLDPRSSAAGHTMIDFGDDQLTAGRPHPMIDQTLRLDQLAIEAADPDTGVLMLDVVLGHGAHSDPAAELAPAIAAASADRAARAGDPARARQGSDAPTAAPDLTFVVSLIGTRSDPQGLADQARALSAAGAHVFASNAQAARFACELIDGRRSAKGDKIITENGS